MAQSTQKPWIRGTIRAVPTAAKRYGFIAPLDNLPQNFQNRQVYFPATVVRWNVQVGDLVEFQLNDKNPDRPSTYRVRHIAPDGSVLNDNIPVNAAASAGSLMSENGILVEQSTASASQAASSDSTERSERTKDNRKPSDRRQAMHAGPNDDDVKQQMTLGRRQRHLNFGKVKTVKDTFGFIKREANGEEEENERDLYFSLSSTNSGLLELASGDEVSFTVSESKPNSDARPYANNVRLVRCANRGPDVIGKYLASIFSRTTDNESGNSNASEDIALVLMCTPVWECVGRCAAMSSETFAQLVDLLVKFNDFENLKQNFTLVLETLLKSNIFIQTDGPFVRYIASRVAANNSGDQLARVKELIFIMTRLVPNRSRQLTAFITPMISHDPQSNDNFLYRLLRQVVKGSSTAVENMAWDELPLVPSVDELLSLELESLCSLRRVVVEGTYQSAEVYLDTYFRLLRVDCFSSLTKGVTDLLRGKLDSRDMNVYRGVLLAGIHLTHSGNGMAIGLRINPPPGVNLDRSSNLMFGNLLCISISGTFRDPIWATVINRDLLKDHRIVIVELCSESNTMSDSEAALALYFAGTSTVIVESPTYYRAYQPVLKSLQLMTPDDLVFHDELIQCQGGQMPVYISPDTDFDGTIVYPELRHRTNVISYCMDETSLGTTTLDASQECAIKECLRNRISIVQGPPGTGKTFVGVKIIQLIMSLSTKITSPILILTYKNHSLDEFLKELVKLFPDCVARVGGRSQEPELSSCSIHELKKKHRMSENVFKQITAFKTELETAKTSMDSAFEFLNHQRYFTVEILLESLTNDQVIEFLSKCEWHKLNVRPFKNDDADDDDDDSEFHEVLTKHITRAQVASILAQCNEQSVRRVIETTLTERKSLGGKLHKLLSSALKYWLPNDDMFAAFEKEFTKQDFTFNDYQQTSNVRSTTEDDASDERDIDELLKERLASASTKQSDAKEFLKSMNMFKNLNNGKGHLLKIAKELSGKFPLSLLLGASNLWDVTIRDRIQMVQCVLHRKFEEAGKDFENIFADYQKVYRSKEELEDQHKASVLQHMKVVGMTVTGANINRSLIAQMKPAVVLVEEAAEVLEPQLVAVLGNWTKHLILIGDHKQLRPSVENYRLAVEYHLDVSMMERLINNKLSYATLTMQNRMRPEFAELLLDIYPTLQSNMVRVQNNEPPNCIGRTMFFWDHKDPEVSERSFTNPSEAERAVRLALFLIEQGYRPRQVTILSPYLGQVRLLRQKVRDAEKKYAELFADKVPLQTKVDNSLSAAEKSIQVHTVDLYQGDENDAVIVSLVRSNPRGDIGFVKQLNRRCVAQSRARCGLYFIGNCETIARHHHWKKLVDGLDAAKCVGTAIPLHCPDHPSQTQMYAADADQIPIKKTFCHVVCNAYLPCGKHVCVRTCQPRHSHGVCRESVEFVFVACGHVGIKECYKDETLEICSALVPITFVLCGHQGNRKCHQKDEDASCVEPCTKILECSHACEKMCGETCDPKSCPTCEKIREEEIRKRREQEQLVRDRIRKHALDKIQEIQAMKPEDMVRREDLSSDGDTAAEYFSVEDRVKRYIQPGHNWFPRITRIEKITNLKLEMEWLHIQSKMFDPTRSELKFHGTNKSAVESIINTGFLLPKYKKQNMFGAGLYFASDSSKSAQKLYTKGSNMLLICDVLLGRSKTVEKARPGMNAAQLKKEKYDSLFAKRDTKSSGGVQYDEFVVYNQYQAIPRYVVHYETLDCRAFADTLEQQARSSDTAIVHHNIATPKRACAMGELEMHFRIAESQFLRLMMIKGMTMSVTSVDYYLNPQLLMKFLAKQEELKSKYGDTEPSKFVLAFHGTTAESIASIVNTNFDLSLLSKNTGSCGKYGAGIYFSEFPDVSLYYGNSGQLLLCRVLPGKSYDCLERMPGKDLVSGFDSHRAGADSEGRGQELVIFNADQILPCYVINYEQQPSVTPAAAAPNNTSV